MSYHMITGRTARLPSDLHLPPLPKKRSKYRNVPVVVDGIRFASKAEATRYGELKLLLLAGSIRELYRQPEFYLPGGIRYIGDFEYTEKGKQVVEDVKGVETKEFKLKAKLFREAYPDIELRIVKAK